MKFSYAMILCLWEFTISAGKTLAIVAAFCAVIGSGGILMLAVLAGIDPDITIEEEMKYPFLVYFNTGIWLGGIMLIAVHQWVKCAKEKINGL
jgi:hypothetical protein